MCSVLRKFDPGLGRLGNWLLEEFGSSGMLNVSWTRSLKTRTISGGDLVLLYHQMAARVLEKLLVPVSFVLEQLLCLLLPD